MFCTKCGKQISENAKFCTGCGTQINRSDSKQPKMEPPKMQQPLIQQPQAQRTEKVKKKGSAVIVLLVALLLLVLAAGGMAAYYFLVLKNDNFDRDADTEEVIEDLDMDDEQEDVEEEDESEFIASESDDSEAEAAEEAADVSDASEEPAVEEESLSDTNEVVKGTVLYNIPKSVYSYDFDESLGNAQVVIRNEIDTMPQIADDIEPKYVSGMDGKAVYLDGTYGLRLSDVQKVGLSYTVAFWMKADAFYDWAPFIHIGHDLLNPDQRCRLWLGQKTDGASVAPILSSEQVSLQISYEIRPTGAISSMQPGVWYYIVYTVDGTKKGSGINSVQGTLYVVGQYAGGGDVAVDVMNVDNLDVYLGINCWDVLYPVAFDSVKIWDQALDANQVKELFNAY